ncbi:uncharacterized protein RAG0_10394 [Rhynchosporium agropyri]|uniref:RRM domain-containing protein n=1 Tax=Rhynchosporium agropyri TaxID=914238 RepID=A0A1E1KZP0_9HELO|nr:uncharacterized protein RAG0_10394 [Rhynchosporium agropyri]
MPPAPTSFSQVYHDDNWKLIRDYGVPQIQEDLGAMQSRSQIPGPASKISSASWQDSHQTPNAVASQASLIDTFEEQAPLFYQQLPMQEAPPSKALPSPASSMEAPQLLQVPHDSSGQSHLQGSIHPGSPYRRPHVHSGAGTLELHQKIPLWNGPTQPFIAYPVPQYSPVNNGALPQEPSRAHTPPASPSAIQYRFNLVPMLFNGVVYRYCYPLPEIFSPSIAQIESQTQPAAGHVPQPPAPRNFQPTNMVLEQNGVELTTQKADHHLETGPYQGDLGSEANRRQVHQLPDTHNCTLWLWNIPAALHISDIFDQIDTGAVQCCHIVPPNESHITCAAKLAFMTPDAAAKFKQKVDSADGIWLNGTKLMARFNRDGNLRNDTHQSRVLTIEGPNEIMTSQYWEAYFRKICVFQWDRVLELPCKDAYKKTLQFSFSRLDGQAQACMGAIRNQAEFDGIIRASFAPDRCGNPAVREVEQHYRRLF